MKDNGGIISRVEAGSLADQAGLKAGDKILEVNEQPVKDLIDLNYALADEKVEVLIQNELGHEEKHYFQRRFGEEVGIELEEAVFDSIRQCANNCVFCFIDQMPEGMRQSLYVKDDDYRMSFLHGNFITLTNMTDFDWKRIIAFHLSPLYVSVQTTNGELRRRMLNHIQADRIMEKLRFMESHDIDFHGQIVMCPGYNDGEELNRTIHDLYVELTNTIDVAIVPVGLSRFREGLPNLAPVDQAKALETISIVEKWQKKARQERGHSFVYLADEFYIMAGVPFPPAADYDEFGLLEDGIGMCRKFRQEWDDFAHQKALYEEPKKVALTVGTAVGDTMKKLAASLDIGNLDLTVLPVVNDYFGDCITVTGLLTAEDIIKTIKAQDEKFDALILPGVCLRKGVPVFLDDKTVEDVEQALGLEVRICHFATDLLEQLYHWR